MTDQSVMLVKSLATRFRAALDAIPREQFPVPMSKFPRGSCGDASLLLGAFLVDSGQDGFEYICGTRGSWDDNSWTTHAWLAKGSLIADITADQFDDSPGPVIVSSDSQWHRVFRVDKGRSPGDFRVWTGPGTYHLRGMYSVLRPLLKERDATQ